MQCLKQHCTKTYSKAIRQTAVKPDETSGFYKKMVSLKVEQIKLSANLWKRKKKKVTSENQNETF